MIKKLSLAAAVIATAVSISSCGGAPDEEILSALESLAPDATKMYGIIYGDVLPHGEEDKSGMCVVSSESEYGSIDEIEAAMLEVFTKEYTDVLKITAFNGVSSDEGEISPKFFEQKGILYVCPSVTEDFNVPDAVDLTGATVVKKNQYMAKVNIPLSEGEDDDIEVTLKLVEGEWKIDSPMF